ncbi:MAG TPA: hypothetical protein VJU87_10200 [Gemmatimonadaceae bacterium]|nr:hypothetical protein [Gemmatimonadaceae bacterium]
MTIPARTSPDSESASTTEHHGSARMYDAPSFLETPRAITVRNQEFEQLVDQVSRQLAQLGLTATGRGEVRRAPNRCIVQLGALALTISWVRGRSETVPEGRLLVIEWDGIVGRGAERIPERIAAAKPAAFEQAPATITKEAVLLAAATRADDWRWRREDEPALGYSSAELATLCVESLQRRLDALAS